MGQNVHVTRQKETLRQVKQRMEREGEKGEEGIGRGSDWGAGREGEKGQRKERGGKREKGEEDEKEKFQGTVQEGLCTGCAGLLLY